MFTKASLVLGVLFLAPSAFATDLTCKEIPASGKKSRGDAVITVSIVNHKSGKEKVTVDMVTKGLWKAKTDMGKAKGCTTESKNGETEISCSDDHDNGTEYTLTISDLLFQGTDKAGAGKFDWDTDTGTPSEDNPGDIGRRFDVNCAY